jgi:hypothetical protein
MNPKAMGVIQEFRMDQFVKNHEVNYMLGSKNQTPVQRDVALSGTRSPLRSLRADEQAVERQSVGRTKFGNAGA